MANELEKALKKLQESKSEADYNRVMEILAGQMREGIEVIVPVKYDEQDQNHIMLRSASNTGGSEHMVAFTSLEEYEKGEPGETMPMPLADFALAVMDIEDCEGLVLDPWGIALSLDKKQIQILLQEIVPLTQDQVDLQAGAAAYQRGDFETALQLYHKSATAGNVKAMGNLGYCYYYGRSIPADKAKAGDYWNRAAIFGDICATYKLGDMYCNGDLPEDIAFAKNLYRKAFFDSLEDMDIYCFPDAFLRILRYCSDELEIEQLRGHC